MRWTDDHCHLSQDPARAAEEIAVAGELGVERMVTVGCDVGDGFGTGNVIQITSDFDGRRKDTAFTPRASVAFKPNADHNQLVPQEQVYLVPVDFVTPDSAICPGTIATPMAST